MSRSRLKSLSLLALSTTLSKRRHSTCRSPSPTRSAQKLRAAWSRRYQLDANGNLYRKHSLFSQALERFADSTRASFAAHNASLHLSFPNSMLRALQSCQLQVVMANTGALMTNRAEGKVAAAMENDMVAQFTWDPFKPQANGGVVTLRLGMSDQKYSDFKAKHAAARNLPPALFNDYTIAYNYVHNFHTFSRSVECESSQPFDARRYSLTPPISLMQQQLKFNCTATDTFPPTPFHMLLSSSAGNESVTVVLLTRANGLCQITVTRPSPLMHAPPSSVYGLNRWTCNAMYFNDKAICDCGCGSPDPDCLSGLNEVSGCGWDQPLCDHWGKCSSEETSTLPLRIFLSTPCSTLKLAGDSQWQFFDSLQVFLLTMFCHQVAAACLVSLLYRTNHSPHAASALKIPLAAANPCTPQLLQVLHHHHILCMYNDATGTFECAPTVHVSLHLAQNPSLSNPLLRNNPFSSISLNLSLSHGRASLPLGPFTRPADLDYVLASG